MLIEIRVKNCFSFESEIVFSMKADLRNKKFFSNVHRENHFNILKTAGVYGPNNTGKTCLVKCIHAVKEILLNRKPNIMTNLFNNDSVCELGITFLSLGREFSFDIRYDTKKGAYLYEKFIEILKDQYGNEKEVLWLKKDSEKKEYYCIDDEMTQMMPLMSLNSLLCYMIDTSQFEYLKEMKEIINEFAQKIDIINMNNIPMKRTIDLMKNKNDLQKKIVGFIKNADLYMDDFQYVDMNKIKFNVEDEEKNRMKKYWIYRIVS